MNNKKKKNGSVLTPSFIVKQIKQIHLVHTNKD